LVTKVKVDNMINPFLQSIGRAVKSFVSGRNIAKSTIKPENPFLKTPAKKQQVFKVGEGLDRGTVTKPFAFKETAQTLKTLPKSEPVTTSIKPKEQGVSPYVQAKQKVNYQPRVPINEISQGFLQPFKTVKNVAEAVISIPFKKEARKEFKEGFDVGTLSTASAVERTLGVAAEKVGAGSLSERLNRIADKDQELTKSLSQQNLPVEDNRKFVEKIQDPNFVASGLGTNIPNLLFAMGLAAPAAALGAPGLVVGALGFGAAGALEGGNAYNDAKDFGADDATAEKAMALTGIANGLLETLPITKLLTRSPLGKEIKRKILREIAKRTVRQMAMEGGTESIQEIVSNSVATIYDENRDLFEGVEESAYFGALLGGVASTVTDLPGRQAPGLTIEEVKTDKEGKPLEDPLAKEARKYKSAEEFVKAQPKAFHGTLTESAGNIEKEGFKSRKSLGKTTSFADDAFFGDVTWITNRSKQAQKFAEQMGTDRGVTTFQGANTKVLDVFLDKGIKLSKQPKAKNTKEYKKLVDELRITFDGLELPGGTKVIWNRDKIKTKSQLTEIYNKANKPKVGNLAQEAKKYKSADEFVNSKISEKQILSSVESQSEFGRLIKEDNIISGKTGISKTTKTEKNGDTINQFVLRDSTGKPTGILTLRDTKPLKDIVFGKSATISVRLENKGQGIANQLLKNADSEGFNTIEYLSSFDNVFSKEGASFVRKQLTDIFNKAQEVKPKSIFKKVGLAQKYTLEEIKAIEAGEKAKALEGEVKTFSGEAENKYQEFVSFMEDLKPFYKLREQIDGGDVDTFKSIAKEKGLITGDMFGSEDMSDSEMFDMFKERLMTEQPELLSTKKTAQELGITSKESNVVKNTEEFGAIPDSMKKDITAFFRPSRKQTSRAFQLLGNKNTTIPLFDKIFTDWVAQGVDTIIEPYADAFTLGTHSIQNAIKGGLKEFHSNIFDKEKYNIVKAIQEGKVKQVEEAVDTSVKILNNKILEHATPKTMSVFNDFFSIYPDSYIGSSQWYSWVRDQAVGKDVTVYKDIYNDFQKVFQKAFNDLFKVPVTDLESSVLNSFVKRIGMFGGKGQSLVNTNGFRAFESKIFDKYGMVEGFKDIDTTFKLANEYGTKIKLYNEDGAKLTNQLPANSKTGYYFDPPYVLSAKTYKDQVSPDELAELEKFMSGANFVRDHANAFDKGARMALTNDIEEEYIRSVQGSMPSAKTYAYKEGQTPTSLIVDSETSGIVDDFLTTSETVGSGEREEIGIIKEIAREKDLSINTVAGVRKGLGISELKNATPEKLSEMIDFLRKLEPGDSLLTVMQKEGLSQLIDFAGYKNSDLVTKREIIEKYGEKEDILQGRVTKHIAKELFPAVDIKEGHPIITRAVDRSDIMLRKANRNIKNRSKKIDKMMDKAELSELSKFKQLTSPTANREVNRKIFQAMSGESVSLTADERAVVAYLKNFFKKAKLDLGLEKSRKYYIPHIEKQLMEKISDEGILDALKSYLKPKNNDIPVDVLLALDEIIGSEKFFKYALERKGGLQPTVDIRRIVNEYSTLYESKMALDNILPEAQASQQLLLQKKSKIWMKEFLQNLKGRALDNKFRTSEMGWMAKTADRIIDFNYVRLLGGNYMSAFKNIMGGEMNSFVYQDLFTYLKGKQRFVSSPKASFKAITESGILDGTYVDFARSGVNKKLVRTSEMVLYGGMEIAEYEIRGTYFVGELTDAEWKQALAGNLELSDKRFREILDGLAITQGIYTKVDSPLFAQTWYGRAMIQFGRWRITNAMLLRRISNGAMAEYKAGNYKGPNTRKVLKMLVSTGVMVYLAWELGKRGHKEARKVALAGTELIKNIYEIFPPKVLYDVLSHNPSIETLGSFVFTIDTLLSYIGFEEPYPIEIKKTLPEMYVAGLKTLGIRKSKKKESSNPFLKSKSSSKKSNPFLN